MASSPGTETSHTNIGGMELRVVKVGTGKSGWRRMVKSYGGHKESTPRGGEDGHTMDGNSMVKQWQPDGNAMDMQTITGMRVAVPN